MQESFFSMNTAVNQNRGHPLKLVKNCVKTDIRKYFFSYRVDIYWNSLPSVVIQCETVATFKKHLDDYFDSFHLVCSFFCVIISLAYSFFLVVISIA